MGWKHTEPPKTCKCTRPLVQEFYQMQAWDGDRDLKPHLASAISTALSLGQFRVASFACVYCKETKCWYRINGKHTSHVLAEMNGTFPKDLIALVERYEADTKQDVAKLYATYDNPSHNRSNIDIYQAFAAADPRLLEVSRRILSVCASGIAFSIWEDSLYQHKREDRAMLLLQNADFVLYCNTALAGATSNVGHVKRSPVVAAMHKTYAKSRKASVEFWELVRDGSGPDHTSADRMLNKYLLKTSVGRGRGADKTKSQDDHRAMMVRCIHAWNAWRGGDSTNLAYHEDKPTPPVK